MIWKYALSQAQNRRNTRKTTTDQLKTDVCTPTHGIVKTNVGEGQDCERRHFLLFTSAQ